MPRFEAALAPQLRSQDLIAVGEGDEQARELNPLLAADALHLQPIRPGCQDKRMVRMVRLVWRVSVPLLASYALHPNSSGN